MAPVERAIYRFCGIDPAVEMNWKQFLKALLTVNLFWFFWGMLLLVFQGWLPLNPDGNPGQSPDLAFNTCISFMVNCNLQHYSGETGLSYFTQLFVIMLFQFVTAACGMAAMAGMMKALAGKTKKTIGNFWVFLTRSVTRILLPLSMPSIATITLFYAVSYWNAYFYSILFITDRTLYPIQAILRQVLMSSEFNTMLYDDATQSLPSEMLKCAMIVITALPILCVYPFLQRYFVKGIMVGSLKG